MYIVLLHADIISGLRDDTLLYIQTLPLSVLSVALVFEKLGRYLVIYVVS